MFKTNKKKNLIKSILIIFIILIPYFFSGQGESYSKKNQKYIKKLNHQNKYHQNKYHQNKYHQNKYHQNISLKKRIYNFFYQRRNYALIKSFFFKKKQFIRMNHPSEAEYLFKKKYYKKALIHFNNIMNKSLFKKELYNNIIKKIALCNFYLKKSDLAINFFKILLKDNAEEKIFHLGMCYYLQSNDYFFFKKNRNKYIKIFLFLRKNYPNTKYLPKIDKMICVSYLKKEKRVNILIKKKEKSSVNDYQDVFNIQKENSCFEETMKLHNTYFIDKMKILFLMRFIYLYHRKLTKSLMKSNEFKKI
ncbi:hypothetical protein [Candidatus Karelsulcia muelleri]|uniref:hypothetical protein n=1 Tax=Candidatus Karelsulcia muelleri TaxID=336810 RepID=UPI0021686A3D|nr:hypothetical protein [Candidatus Karelsulcia muelleri]